MKFRISTLALAAVLAAMFSTPALAVQPSVVEAGDMRLVSAHVATRLATTRALVHVASTDGHDEIAANLNNQIAAAGYNVSSENPEIRYTVKEVYAGEAEKYTPPVQKQGKIGFGALFNVLATAATCAGFGACNNVMFMANEVQADLAHVSKDLDSKNGVDVPDQPRKPVLIVEYEVCRMGRGCANTLAASFSPAITLDQLRKFNTEEGLPRAINLKKD